MNTRLVSVAILSGNNLLEYFTHLHKSSWSPAKAEQIVASLEPCVRQYSIKKAVLSIPYAFHQTPEYYLLLKALTTFFQRLEIPFVTHTPDAFKAFHEVGEKKRRKAMMQSIAMQFPELYQFYQKEMRNKKKYYYKLFEAVAVAVLGEQQE